MCNKSRLLNILIHSLAYLFLFIILITFSTCERREKVVIIDVNDLGDSLTDSLIDCCDNDTDLFMGYTEEEFCKEMMKGERGDLTQEQYDSIMNEIYQMDTCFNME